MRPSDIVALRVSPKEIENAHYQLEDIGEAIVISLHGKIMGKVIKVKIVLRGNSPLMMDDAVRYYRENIEEVMVLKQIVVVEGHPKSDSGEVLKKAPMATEEKQ